MFIVKVERYFEFGLFASLPKTNWLVLVEQTAESGLDSAIKYFRFRQVIARFEGTIIVKFLGALCFTLIHLTSWKSLRKLFRILNFNPTKFMIKTAVLHSVPLQHLLNGSYLNYWAPDCLVTLRVCRVHQLWQ